jgi:hypothetical protein
MRHIFQRENAELLVSCARLSLSALDRMTSAMPPGEAVPANEMAALVRLIGGALNFGIDASRADFNERNPANEDGNSLDDLRVPSLREYS